MKGQKLFVVAQLVELAVQSARDRAEYGPDQGLTIDVCRPWHEPDEADVDVLCMGLDIVADVLSLVVLETSLTAASA